MHDYEIKVLDALKNEKHISNIGLLEKKSGLSNDKLNWALQNLSKSGMISIEYSSEFSIELTTEGKVYAEKGLPEIQLLKKVNNESALAQSISKDNAMRIGMQWAVSKGLVKIEQGKVEITHEGKDTLEHGYLESKVLELANEGKASYDELNKLYQKPFENLAKRHLINVSRKNAIAKIEITEKGLNAISTETDENEIGALDRSTIMNYDLSKAKFKPYDINVNVDAYPAAKKHPLRNLIREIRSSYSNMGFKEVTGPIVIPAFWTFDSLFVPQDHPAREMQDTFYLSRPSKLEIEDKEVVSKVKKEHEKGWKYKWSEDIAKQSLLRTHTTSVSVAHLFRLNEYKDYLMPLKLFSVGRIFRNENVDYRHAADFYQMDGIVVGENLTLANLFHILRSLYEKLGFEIKFKPSYFPFVEPGVEIFAYYKKRNEWLEMGGGGIFRKEITGIAKKNIKVLAWGLGVERTLLMRDESIQGIGEMYNSDMDWIRNRQVL